MLAGKSREDRGTRSDLDMSLWTTRRMGISASPSISQWPPRLSTEVQSILSSGTAIPHPALAPFPCRTYGLGNIDLQVLSPKNQNQTVVTPLVADLAQNLFRDSFYVLGPQPTSHSAPQDSAHQMLIQWLSKTIQPRFKSGALVEFTSRVNYVDSVKVNHAIYSVGDQVSLC